MRTRPHFVVFDNFIKRSVLSIACIVGFMPIFVFAQNRDANSLDIEDARLAIEKWVEAQSVISREKQDWQLAEEMLNERIKLIENEIETLRVKIGDAEKNIAEADKKRLEMTQENEKLKQSSVMLGEIAAPTEKQTLKLISRLPEPIKERIKPLSQRLPSDPNQTKQSISERFQNIIGILNEVDKFNREISVTSEVRNLPDGTSVEVAALYIGIGQAYYASANGSIAGSGTVSNDGWVWKPNNEYAAQIADAISILKNEKVASFVQVPVEIK